MVTTTSNWPLSFLARGSSILSHSAFLSVRSIGWDRRIWQASTAYRPFTLPFGPYSPAGTPDTKPASHKPKYASLGQHFPREFSLAENFEIAKSHVFVYRGSGANSSGSR